MKVILVLIAGSLPLAVLTAISLLNLSGGQQAAANGVAAEYSSAVAHF